MAEQKIEIDITWENQVGFSVEFKKNGGDTITILDADENGEIALLWPHYEAAILAFITRRLAFIGDEMKA